MSSHPFWRIVDVTLMVVAMAGSVLCGAVDRAAALQNSLPSLTPATTPKNLAELWAGYDPTVEPLDVKVVHEWHRTYRGHPVILQMLTYTVGVFKGKVSRMGAYYAYPTNVAGKLPGLLQMHGGGQRAMPETAEAAAANGYACIAINWGGLPMADQKPGDAGTDWGAVDPTQTHNGHYASLAPDARTIDAVTSPRNNNWFLLTIAGRRALTFLAQQPNVDKNRLGVFGHSMGGTLTVMVAGIDPRVKAAVPSCGGAGSMPKRGAPLSLYDRTIAELAYLRHITCPILYLGPQNDFNGIYDNMNATWREIPSRSVHLSDSPHLNHRHLPESYFASWRFFDVVLRHKGTFPATPRLKVSLHTTDGVPMATVRPDQPGQVVRVQVYYSINPDSRTRFWRSADTVRQGGTWQARLPILSTSMPLFVMANVFYPQPHPFVGDPWSGESPATFLVSSWEQTFQPSALQAAGVKATDHVDRTIEHSFANWDDWYRFNWDNPYWRSATTRKLTDPKWRGPDGASLAIDVRDPAGGEFDMTFVVNGWGVYAGVKGGSYYAAAPLAKTNAWQTVIFRLSDLKPLSKNSPPHPASWQGITELSITAALHHKPWTDKRQFRDLRWVGGMYKSPVLWPTGTLSAKEFQRLYQDNIDRSVRLENRDAQNARRSH